MILMSESSFFKPLLIYSLEITEVFKIYMYFHRGFRWMLSKSQIFAPKKGQIMDYRSVTFIHLNHGGIHGFHGWMATLPI